MNLSDAQLKVYIDEIFDRYDADRSGNLDAQELANFFNDLFRTIGNPTVITPTQAQNAICSIDKNNDGKANKMELFMAFKGIISNQQYQQQSMMQSRGYQPNPYQPNLYQQNPYPQQGIPNGYYGSQPGYAPPMQPNQPYGQPQMGYGYQSGYQQPMYNNQYPNQGYNPQQGYGQPMYGSGGRW